MSNKEYVLSPTYKTMPRKEKTSHKGLISMLLMIPILTLFSLAFPTKSTNTANTFNKEFQDYKKRTKDLTKEDFENAQWIPYENKNARIWTPYMNEEINHSIPNWGAYQHKVNEKNPQGLKGNILIPDLDGNAVIGNQLYPSAETLKNILLREKLENLSLTENTKVKK